MKDRTDHHRVASAPECTTNTKIERVTNGLCKCGEGISGFEFYLTGASCAPVVSDRQPR